MRLRSLLFALVAISITSCNDMKEINGEYDVTMVGSNDYSQQDITMNIEMGEENRISGKSACNQYSGNFTNPKENQVEMGMMMGTKMYCKDTSQIERDYLDHLSQVTAVNKTKTGLDLLNEEGKVIIVAVKKENK
jgi:heat shock protein HslJ